MKNINNVTSNQFNNVSNTQNNPFMSSNMINNFGINNNLIIILIFWSILLKAFQIT